MTTMTPAASVNRQRIPEKARIDAEDLAVRRRDVTATSPKRSPDAHQRSTMAWKMG